MNESDPRLWRKVNAGEAGIILVSNATLLAAAQQMLDVLVELQESASYWSEYDVPLGIVDRINAAIAKACGKES